jgi:serine/threonine-protein kinase
MKKCPTCHNIYPDETEFCPHHGTRLTITAPNTKTPTDLGFAGRFHVVRQLGIGGMGTVFLAEQIAVGNRLVALKVLSRKLLDDPEFLRRFQNEAASTGRIRHPNVVTVYESGQGEEGTPYIAMEYLEGETLRQALTARGALPVAECAKVLRQAARGLHAAHRLGILHRDLKPNNIFLTRSDEGGVIVKVLDFGMAKLREFATQTLTGTVLGTPAYMSFEQASGMKSDDLDARSDIYSLGVVAYEMLAGQVPFHSETPLGYLRKHLQDTPTPLRTVRPELATLLEVDRIVMKALAKDRTQRYASALEFAREFTSAASAQAPAEAFAKTTVVDLHEKGRPEDRPRTWEKLDAERRGAQQGEVDPLLGDRAGTDRRGAEQTDAARLASWHAEPDRLSGNRQAAENERVVSQSRPRVAGRLIFAGDSYDLGREKPVKKFLILGLLALAVIGGETWHLLHQAQQTQTGEPSHETPTTKAPEKNLEPAVQEPVPGPTSGAAEKGLVPPLPPAVQEPVSGTTRVNPKDGLKYVWIPPGTFTMGCSPGDNECEDQEKPAHQVTITRGFWIGVTPVTVGEYKLFAGAMGHQMPPEPGLSGRALNPGWGNDAMPIVDVTWDEAQAYCSWSGGRLPTEAEWEYGARAGSTEARYGALDDVAWYADNSGLQRMDSTLIWNTDPRNYPQRLKDNGNGMHEVGMKRPNAFGLCDVLGNVWQWVNDRYAQNYYQSSPSQGPQGPGSGQYRVVRGGSWVNSPSDVRVSYRAGDNPTFRFSGNGFRCSVEVF